MASFRRSRAILIPALFGVIRFVGKYLLVPTMISRMLNVPAMGPLFAVLAGFALTGVVGALVAIPVAVAIALLAQGVLFPGLDESQKPRRRNLGPLVQPMLRETGREPDKSRALSGYRSATSADSLNPGLFAGGEVDDGAQRESEQPPSTAVQVERVSCSDIVVRVIGGLRDEVSAQLRRTVVGKLMGSPEALVLDMTMVTGIDADGVDVLETAAALAGENDIFFCLVLPPDSPILAALADEDLSALFEIFSTVAEALRKTSI